MYILEIFFKALASLVSGVCQILYILLFARIIVSWLPVDPYHSVVQFLLQVTEPILAPFRRLPLRVGMIDLSPLLAFFVLFLLRDILVVTFTKLAYQFSGSPGF